MVFLIFEFSVFCVFRIFKKIMETKSLLVHVF